MKILVDGQYLDLYQDTEATIDFTIQPNYDITKRFVSQTGSFSVPATDSNKTILDPQVTGKSKYTGVTVTFENGFSLTSTLYVNTANEYVFGEEFSIKLVSSLSESLNQIGKDGIENIFSTSDNFDYIFNDDATYTTPPIDPSTEWFFLSASNRNGDVYDSDAQFPIYADRMIVKNEGQLYVTMSLYNFFSKVFTKYSIPIGFAKTDDVMTGITLDDLYIFIPVKLKSTAARTMSFELTKLGVISSYTDYLYQIGMQANPVAVTITATTDTIYKIAFKSQSAGYDIKFELTEGCDGHDITPSSGTVEIKVRIKKDDELYKNVSIATLTAAQVNTTVSTTVDELIEDVEFLATSELEFEYYIEFHDLVFDFDASYACDGSDIQSQTLDGEYDATKTASGPGYAWNIASASNLDVTMTSTENISPGTRITTVAQTVEEIDMPTTMEKTGLKIKDIINDLLIRFNAGFYLDSLNKIRFGTYINRYNTASTIYATSWENGYSRTYTHNALGIFNYENKADNRVGTKITDADGNKRLIGDVVNQNFGGDSDEKITLKSSYALRDLYQDEKHIPDTSEIELLETKDSSGKFYAREYWGIPYNDYIKNNDLGFLVGFLSSSNTAYNILIPSVKMIDFATSGTQPSVMFSKNGNVEGTYTMGGSDIGLYVVEDSFTGGETLYLGDLDGNVDTTSTLYTNFIPVLNPYDNYININIIVDVDIIYNLLDGSIVTIANGDGINVEYYPLEIKGISLEREYSIAEIKLIKKV